MNLGLWTPFELRYVPTADLLVVALGTCEVEVRLIDCYAPPRLLQDRGKCADVINPAAGQAAKRAEQLLRLARPPYPILHVPLPAEMARLLPLPRAIAGNVILSQHWTLNRLLVHEGHCVDRPRD